MAMFDFVCSRCQYHFERFFKSSSNVPNSLPCESCGPDGDYVAELTFEPSIALKRPNSFAQSFDPVVIHKDASGNVRFPANSNAPIPAGFQKVELTNLHQIRQLEKEVNSKESAKLREHRYSERASSDEAKKVRREAFRQAVAKMSPKGRQFAERAMEYVDQKKSKRGLGDEANFHLEAFSYDSSNREAYLDAQSDWKRRK